MTISKINLLNIKRAYLTTIRLLIYALSLVAIIMLQEICHASPAGSVNILSRYGYLNSPEIISAIENKCHIKVSVDECYGCSECLSRSVLIGQYNLYDITIFTSEYYEILKPRIARRDSDLNKVVTKYSNFAKNHYLSYGYPPNVVYFALSLTGFIWNPSVIDLTPNDTATTMFEKAKNNIVVLKNSLSRIWFLFNNKHTLPQESLVDNFNQVIRDSDIYITNGYNGLYNKNRFAFAYQRSGEAVSILKQAANKNLAFLVHPEYSYISPDLIAELNSRPETRCAARALASKEILDIVQRESNYLSPYGTYQTISDPILLKVYNSLLNNIKKTHWLDTYFAKSYDDYFKLRKIWQQIHTLAKVNKNNSVTLRRPSNKQNNEEPTKTCETT